jgi:hypothetical protein
MSREVKMSEEERLDIAKTIKEIEGYKEKFDNWRNGKDLEIEINVQDAAEQIEIIHNYYLSRPCEVFRNYEFVTAVAEVGDREAKNWSGKEAANAFESVKAKVVEAYNSVKSESKTITMIDMGMPSLEDGKFIMYIQMNVGVGKIDGLTNKTDSRSSADTRWAE